MVGEQKRGGEGEHLAFCRGVAGMVVGEHLNYFFFVHLLVSCLKIIY